MTMNHLAQVELTGRSPRSRLVLALVVAGVSDFVSFLLELVPPTWPVTQPLQWVVDVATALILFVIFGWRWVMLPGLLTEATPGLAIFPWWLMVVAFIGAQDELSKRKAAGTPVVTENSATAHLEVPLEASPALAAEPATRRLTAGTDGQSVPPQGS